jgi:hypothetical protein
MLIGPLQKHYQTRRGVFPWLDPISTPRHILCLSRKVISTYTGSLIQVRRSNDNALQDIGFDAAGWLDIPAIASHCGANTGTIRTVYDQSGNGKNHTNTTNANQPQIWDGSAVTRFMSSSGMAPAGVWDGLNDSLSTTTAAVGTGNPAMSCVANMSDAGDTDYLMIVGDQTNALRQMRLHVNSDTSMTLDDASTGSQQFNVESQTKPHWYQLSKAASVTTAAWVLRQDGTPLTNASGSGANNLAIVSGNVSCWGCRFTGAGALTEFQNMRSSFFGVWGVVFSTEEQLLIDRAMQALLNAHRRG